jgi:uncharacterized protein DUF5655
MQDTRTDVALFEGKDPVVRAIYERLLDEIRALGPFTPEAKKTSIHLVHTGGFAGVLPRKGYLYLNLRLDHALDSPRAAKVEQVSKNRWHNEIRLEHPDQIDAELLSWLREAYTLK